MSYTCKKRRSNCGSLSKIEYFTNDAFRSMPRKIECKCFSQQISYPFMEDCTEVSSIADVTRRKETTNNNMYEQSQNPYEVIRKLPTRKENRTNLSKKCFENPALNLNAPEKQINRFEVRREISTAESDLRRPQFYINKALNIRSQDNHSVYNPFEVQRCAQKYQCNGIENLGLNDQNSDSFRIELPFQPTVNCRIDFKNISLSELTPSKLLTEELVFSPNNLESKRSLDLVNDENTLDFGKELDRYQLELENSINEAKLRKNAVQTPIQQSLIYPIRKTISQSLNITKNNTRNNKREKKIGFQNKQNLLDHNNLYLQNCIKQSRKISVELGEKFLNHITEDIHALESNEGNVNHCTRSQKVLIAENSSDRSAKTECNKLKIVNGVLHEKSKINDKDIMLVESLNNTNIITCLRHSLRRKRPFVEKQLSGLNISIIDTEDRIMKLKSEVPETIQQFTNKKKNTLRSTFKHPTRDFRCKLKKSLFQKSQEEYVLPK